MGHSLTGAKKTSPQWPTITESLQKKHTCPKAVGESAFILVPKDLLSLFPGMKPILPQREVSVHASEDTAFSFEMTVSSLPPKVFPKWEVSAWVPHHVKKDF